jgi:hypothetical protein
MIDPEMSERLRTQAFVTALKGFYLRDLETRLRQGERVPFYLPHSSGPDDRVEIGGTFFSAAKNPIREVEDILAALMAAARPFCEGWIFELDIRSLERVEWRARDWSDETRSKEGRSRSTRLWPRCPAWAARRSGLKACCPLSGSWRKNCQTGR